MESDREVDKTHSDALFSLQKQVLENQSCFDCGSKNPNYCVIHFGVLICHDCSLAHKEHTSGSYIKNIHTDKWTLQDLSFIENGGNKRAHDYFSSQNVTQQTYFMSPVSENYKNILLETVNRFFPQRSLQEDRQLEESKENPHQMQRSKTISHKLSPIKQEKATSYKFRKVKTEEITEEFVFRPVLFKANNPVEPEIYENHHILPPLKPVIAQIPQPVKSEIKTPEKKTFSSEDYNTNQ